MYKPPSMPLDRYLDPLEQAAFSIFSQMAAQEPHGNAWEQAHTAFRLATAFSEVRRQLAKERGDAERASWNAAVIDA